MQMLPQTFKKNYRRGFTLIELLIVIVLLSAVSAVVTMSLSPSVNKGDASKAIKFFKNIEDSANLYALDNGFYPPEVPKGCDPGFRQKLPTYADKEVDCVEEPDIPDYHPSGWETSLDESWLGPYLDDWPTFTPWDGKYDYDLVTSSRIISGGCLSPGVYISMTTNYLDSDPVPQNIEQYFIDQDLDSDNVINGEVHFRFAELKDAVDTCSGGAPTATPTIAPTPTPGATPTPTPTTAPTPTPTSSCATTDTFYFDASDGGPYDTQSVWTDDASLFDGDINTPASTTTNGTLLSKYLMGEGTNAPGCGDTITSVQARIYGSYAVSSTSTSAFIYTNGLGEWLGTPTNNLSTPGWGSYTTLTEPTTGWSWPRIQSLEVKVTSSTSGPATALPRKIEILVTTSAPTPSPTIDYTPIPDPTGSTSCHTSSDCTSPAVCLIIPPATTGNCVSF